MSFKSGSLCALKFSLIKPSSLMTHQFFYYLLHIAAIKLSRNIASLRRPRADMFWSEAKSWPLNSVFFFLNSYYVSKFVLKTVFPKVDQNLFFKILLIRSSLLSDLLIYHDFKVRLICYEHVHYLGNEYSWGPQLGVGYYRTVVPWLAENDIIAHFKA